MPNPPRLPLIRTAHYRSADGWTNGQAVCRAGHTLDIPNRDFGTWSFQHESCEAIRWVGAASCRAVFVLLGREHPADELDHSEIRGLGPGYDMTAKPGDRIVPDGAGWFFPMPDDEYQAAIRD